MYLGRGNLALLVRAKDGRRIVCTSLAPKAVPKFASFRPKPDQLSKNPSSDGARDPEHRGAGSTVSERYHDSHDYHSTGTDVRRHKSKSRRQPLSQDRQGQDKISHITVIPWDDEPDIFIVDKVGDTANLEYGSLHRYAIPSYFRSGSGRILGLSNDQKIDRQASNEKSVIVSDSYRDQHVKRDKAVFARIGRDRETRVKPVFSAAKCSIDVDADYLSLGHQRLNKRQRLEAEAVASLGESTEDESSHYRSIEGKAKATIVPEDSDLEFNDTVSDSKREVSPMDDVNLRKLALSRKVDSEPSNGDAWLKLIDYQETVLSYQSGNGRSSAADRASMADIKLCMYEKALTLVETPHYTERLLLGIMESGTKIWDLRKVSSKWKTLLQQHVGYMGLWTKYLDFQQTNFAAFRFDEVRVGFVTCLGIIREAIIKAGTNQAQRDTLITIQIYVLLRLTLCTREAGFPEQSTAIWQAVLEFNCCRSLALTVESQVSVPFERLLAGFEDFWESEVSRMGEENSVGWRNYNAHDGRLPHPKADDSMPNGIGRPIIADWSEYEAAHFSQSRKPARTIDDTVEDDPYRVVLFSDVKDFIVDVPSSSHQLLLYAFLAFCHLPTPENPAEDARAWWRDPFIRNDGQCGWERLLHSLSNLSEGIKLQLQPEKDNSTSASLTQALGLPTQFYLPSTASLFAKRGSWFSAFDEWTAQCAKNNGPVDADWTRQVLRMLVDNGIGGDNVAEYLLALECNVMPSAAKKTAKALLKKDPSSLRLYNAYALIECRLGNLGIAESVFTTAINMSRSLDEISQKNVILLWRTWIWELLDSKNADSALERLLTLPDEVITVDSRSIVANPATNLRTQKALVDGRDQALSLTDYRHALLYSECLILLDYLKNSLSMEAALSSFETQISLLTSRLPSDSPHHELLHQTRAQILHYHTTRTHAFKPALIRSTLTESIKLFPQNTIFLSLYAQNETRFRIDDRVRSIVNDVLLSKHNTGAQSTESIIPHFFAVYAELNRSTTVGSNIHSIRGVFERAIDSQCGTQSAAMWKLYFLFEHSRGELQRARAVFYRAVRACPWVKELYLLPFKYLKGAMPIEELKGVYQTVVERELRVFVNLDEAFEVALQNA